LKSRDKKEAAYAQARSKKTDSDADLNQSECADGNDNTLTHQQNDCTDKETGEEDMSEEEDSNEISQTEDGSDCTKKSTTYHIVAFRREQWNNDMREGATKKIMMTKIR